MQTGKHHPKWNSATSSFMFSAFKVLDVHTGTFAAHRWNRFFFFFYMEFLSMVSLSTKTFFTDILYKDTELKRPACTWREKWKLINLGIEEGKVLSIITDGEWSRMEN